MRPPTRGLVVDDHPVVRSGLRLLLGTIDGLEVVGEAADGETAGRECRLLGPDVVLTGLAPSPRSRCWS